MKFKKGDIIEVIEKDFSGGKVYEVGSRWEVVHEDDKNGGYTDDIVYVKDDTRPSGRASLYTSCVKKVEGENEMQFKKGDIVEVIQPEYSAGKVYEVGSRWEVVREDEKNEGKPWDLVYVKDDTRPTKLAIFYIRSVKKVEDLPEELMIPVSLVYQVLASEPTNREIKAFLKGYKEGLNKNKTTD